LFLTMSENLSATPQALNAAAWATLPQKLSRVKKNAGDVASPAVPRS
jgi:hypothetical protein